MKCLFNIHSTYSTGQVAFGVELLLQLFYSLLVYDPFLFLICLVAHYVVRTRLVLIDLFKPFLKIYK